jgi:hypothetical protein
VTDDIAVTIRDLEAVIASAAAVADRLRALQARADTMPRSVADFSDFVRPMEILRDYAVSRAELHRRSKKYQIGTPGGFSYVPPGKKYRLISVPLWKRHLAQYPLRKRRSGTK